MKIVDGHVHCRDEAQSEKDTIARVSYFAARSGVGAIFDMPNTSPPIISRDQVESRLELARDTCAPGVSYGLHIGVTSDPAQIREAVECYNELSLREDGRVGVVGLKMFAGKSVGDLAVIEECDQRRVYDTLADCGYEGVLVAHCEKESFMRPDLWDPKMPVSHSFSRPSEAELESIRDQVGFFYNSNFNGKLHIAHVSTPEAVDYICNVRCNEVKSMRISCGVTPQHLFLNTGMMEDGGVRAGKSGLSWKVNPPLRTRDEQLGLLGRLKEGKINCIETDHANHKLSEKMSAPFMSGIPGISSWPNVVERLKQEGFSEERIGLLTGKNVLDIYGLSEDVVGDGKVVEDSHFEGYSYGYGDVI